MYLDMKNYSITITRDLKLTENIDRVTLMVLIFTSYIPKFTDIFWLTPVNELWRVILYFIFLFNLLIRISLLYWKGCKQN